MAIQGPPKPYSFHAGATSLDHAFVIAVVLEV